MLFRRGGSGGGGGEGGWLLIGRVVCWGIAIRGSACFGFGGGCEAESA